ncbi:MAG TPA: HAD family hydrolase [Cytophagales bacterium]|jgi:2-haloacid dehalogenase|nr:HAD family hydrolase [Cytophagales bacterium]
MKTSTVIFYLGGVLIDWNPRYLYRKIFKTEEEIDWFLQHVCTSEWNEKQDAGCSFDEATNELIAQFPDHEIPIRAWYDRWEETINGSLPDTVNILREIKESNKYKLLALTNWSAQTFPWALNNFEFLHWFEGIVVSGVEKTRKPFPEFYKILIDRYQFEPTQAIFIDDVPKNLAGAEVFGIKGIHFQSAEKLKQDLIQLGIF